MSKAQSVKTTATALLVLAFAITVLLTGNRQSAQASPAQASPTQQAAQPTYQAVSKSVLPTDPVPDPKQAGVQYFASTGHTLRGSFFDYWQRNGGLKQQGYPISEEMSERSDADDKLYTVQYFERAVFELHPENAGTEYEVLPSLLGAYQYRSLYGTGGAPGQRVSPDNSRTFSETGHSLGGAFRTYWEQHGGLTQQGYPVSDEFPEVSPLDGKLYTVQYFERAVFELHPENAGTEYGVLRSLLGLRRVQAMYGTVTLPAPSTPGLVQTNLVGSDAYLLWDEVKIERDQFPNSLTTQRLVTTFALDLNSKRITTVAGGPNPVPILPCPVRLRWALYRTQQGVPAASVISWARSCGPGLLSLSPPTTAQVSDILR